jgi:hypothetical protein
VDTIFDDHVRNSLFGVSEIEVGPFLELECERFPGDILDSDREWVRSVEGWWAHNNNWVVELVLDRNLVPKVLVRLVNSNSSEFNDSITSDLGEVSVHVQVFLTEIHPGSTVASEGPGGGDLSGFGDVEDLEDVVSSGSIDAESEVLSLFGRSDRSNDLAVPKYLSSVIEIDWESEAVGVVSGRWDHDSGSETNIGSTSGFFADSSIGDLSHLIHLSMAISSSWGSIVKSLHQLSSVLDSISVEFASLDLDVSIFQWEFFNIFLLLDIGVIFLEISSVHNFLSVPDSEVSNNLSGVSLFLILGLLFFNSDVDAVGLEIFVTQGSGVYTVHGLHGSEDAWFDLVEFGVSEIESSTFIGDSVLRNSAEPLSVSFLGKTPSDIGDFFDITHLSVSKFLLGLNQDLESFGADVTLSWSVGVVLLHGGDLSEHNWFLVIFIIAFEVDSLPLRTGVSLTSDDPRSIRKLVGTGLNNHE